MDLAATDNVDLAARDKMDLPAREKAVYLAKLAEQAERYDGMSLTFCVHLSSLFHFLHSLTYFLFHFAFPTILTYCRNGSRDA